MVDREEVVTLASSMGFRPEVLEKVLLLMDLLKAFDIHPYLKNRLVLKGGTALNLFFFKLPRLSVDIDLNYIGSVDREIMIKEKIEIEEIIHSICQQKGFVVQKIPTEYAGGKMVLRYTSVLGTQGNLEIDLNFLLRIPLWPVIPKTSISIGSYQTQFLVLDIHELAAGKFSALFSRHASRDLFDCHYLLTEYQFNQKQLRTAFIIYGAMNKKDWRTISTKDIAFDFRELKNKLLPVLQKQGMGLIANKSRANFLIAECQRIINELFLPFTDPEKAFLDALLNEGEIKAEFLSNDQEFIEKIKQHPALLWKASNVKHYHLQ